MRNKQHVTREIVELSAIKASYNYYLASGRSIFEVENATQLHHNLWVINQSLRQLYDELKVFTKSEANIGLSQRATGNETSAMGGYFLSDEFKALETRAIMQFNSDRRFTITE